MLDRCPLEAGAAEAQVAELMRFAGYVRESRIWPVSGGALDQSPAFLAAESMIRGDFAACRAQLGLPPSTG